jgi:hypothetical protein
MKAEAEVMPGYPAPSYSDAVKVRPAWTPVTAAGATDGVPGDRHVHCASR